MIDVVYPLGRGSRFNNDELRYSLRSVDKHLNNVRNVYIVGELPDWITGVIHVAAQDVDQKETNIMRKVRLACEVPSVSDTFLFMNDDHFFTQDVDAEAYPYYYHGMLSETISKRNKNQSYRNSLYNAMLALHGKQQKHFDIHCPIRYEKKKFIEVADGYNWHVPFGMVVKSIYVNHHDIEGERMSDFKPKHPAVYHTFKEAIKARHIFSIGDETVSPDLWRLMNELYPNKSKYEL